MWCFCGPEVIQELYGRVPEGEDVDYVHNSGKSVIDCDGDLGVNAKTLNDWVVKFKRCGEVAARRTAGQLVMDRPERGNERLALEEEFQKPQPSSPEAKHEQEIRAHDGGCRG